MKKKTSLVMYCMIALGLLAATGAGANDYTLVKQEAGIALYEKWITVSGGETAQELKVVFCARAHAERVIAVLKDPAKGRQWNPHVKEYKVLEEKGKPGWITYIRYGIPWPVGDQDCCLAYTMRSNSQGAELFFAGCSHPGFPVKSGTSRISGVRGKWILENISGDQVRISYIISSDKSKKLPKWVTDPVIHNNMIKSISRFITLIETPGHE